VIDEIRRRLAEYTPQQYEAEGRPCAAVLVLLYQRDDALHVVLTQRTTLVQEHKGQVSFPGGSVDPEDLDVVMTALRESDEEIGLRADHVTLIGRIDDYVMNPGRYHISVLVAEIDPVHSPYAWQPSASEVAEILEVPIGHFLDPVNQMLYTSAARDGVERSWPAVRFGDAVIWGATYDMLRHFMDVAHQDETHQA
jgi:8-oxo-dGTP pyrophosphatase MutT (NUDIX family)